MSPALVAAFRLVENSPVKGAANWLGEVIPALVAAFRLVEDGPVKGLLKTVLFRLFDYATGLTSCLICVGKSCHFIISGL